MSNTYFDRNQNLQVNGDVNFVSIGGGSQDGTNFLQVTRKVQESNSQYQALKKGFEILCNYTTPSARFGYGHSFTGPQCHPGTRVAVQDYIFKWLNDPAGRIVMWMNGPVGIGKSAIAQTVARLAAQRQQLSSAFFFFRSDNARNSARNMVPTLAYEMAQQIPRTLRRVCQVVAADPHIFSMSLDRQINNVLLHPLRTRFESSTRRRRLIIIDGLDECIDTDVQEKIIQSFITSLLSVQIIPHKLLIVSRPESHITSTFLAADINPHVERLPLGLWDTEDDIEIFLRDRLKKVRETHPMKHHLGDTWPDDWSFRELRRRSVGSFAYASCVIRFLGLHTHNPQNVLQDILSLQPLQGAVAFTELDSLYRHILSSLDPNICNMVQRILCLYIFSGKADITLLAGGLLEEVPNIEIAVLNVPSLINFNGQYIALHHKSFEDFLRDKKRSQEYHLFSSNASIAVASALSSKWLQPVCTKEKRFWFPLIAASIDDKRDPDMVAHILRRLIEARIPAKTFTIDQCKITGAGTFFYSLHRESKVSSDVTYSHLFKEASNVVYTWLRSQLDTAFHDHPTLNDILDFAQINLEYRSHPSFDLPLYSFFSPQPFDFLCHLFPEIDDVELSDAIVERYLALSAESRKLDIHYWGGGFDRLFCGALGCHNAMVPGVCHRLEQIVLYKQYKTSKQSIFCGLYGESFAIDAMSRFIIKDYLAVGPNRVKNVWTNIVDTIDNYIRQAHTKQHFPYISKDVETLFQLQAGPFDILCIEY